MSILDDFREMIACPQFGDNHYGSLGMLTITLREQLKDIYDYAKALEERLEVENEN